MKGGPACMAAAVVALRRAEAKLGGRLVFTGVSAEESV
ncbi:MAG: hypothetical protein ACTSUQ_09370 [Candidatus Freyarchaeota archaeon]